MDILPITLDTDLRQVGKFITEIPTNASSHINHLYLKLKTAPNPLMLIVDAKQITTTDQQNALTKNTLFKIIA